MKNLKKNDRKLPEQVSKPSTLQNIRSNNTNSTSCELRHQGRFYYYIVNRHVYRPVHITTHRDGEADTERNPGTWVPSIFNRDILVFYMPSVKH